MRQPEKTFVYLPVDLQVHIRKRASRNDRRWSQEVRILLKHALKDLGDPLPDQAAEGAHDA